SLFDLLAHRLDRSRRLREEPVREVLVLAQQAEQDVLGLDGLGAELARLVAREKDHAPRLLRIVLEHHRTSYSYLSASTASSRAAERDGKIVERKLMKTVAVATSATSSARTWNETWLIE